MLLLFTLFLSILLFLKNFGFGAIINEIVFLMSFLGCLLQVYRNIVDICVLILHVATLLNPFFLVLIVLL